MFRFSADQEHALRHGLQDLGKLTLAVMFLGSSLGMVPGVVSHSTPKHPAHKLAALEKLSVSQKALTNRLNNRL